MLNDGLDEAQAGIKIVRKNINNLRYADDTTWPYGRKNIRVEENVEEGRISQGRSSTHRDPLGSQRQQVLPQSSQGLFTAFI